MKTPKDLPIHCWTDDVDAATYVVCARCYVHRSGMIYGLSVFVLVDRAQVPRWDRRRWTEMGEAMLVRALKTEHYGYLPPVCDARRGKEWGFA